MNIKSPGNLNLGSFCSKVLLKGTDPGSAPFAQEPEALKNVRKWVARCKLRNCKLYFTSARFFGEVLYDKL